LLVDCRRIKEEKTQGTKTMSISAADLAKLKDTELARWRAMTIHADLIPSLDRTAQRLIDHKSTYLEIERETSVKWFWIAPVHMRESDANFTRSLAQGDVLTRRSVNVPAGRLPLPAVPPFTFQAAAIDALTVCDHIDKWTDWSIGGLLLEFNRYNGLWYASHDVPSPYVWASTDQYKGGKFTSDHHYDSNYVDHQSGCAALLARMIALDTSIVIDGAGDVAHSEHPAWDVPSTAPVQSPQHTTLWVQQSLNKLAPTGDKLVEDGLYGDQTKRAVRAFQRAHDLLDDGKAGPITCAAIEEILRTMQPSS
jgi:lysozyme family protein